jgi:hypothetical protein
MKKILLAIDADHINQAAVDLACYIAQLTHSKLMGIFFERKEEALLTHRVYDLPKESIITKEPAGTAIQKSPLQLFEEACANRGIRAQVMHSITKKPARKMVAESRFADCMIIQADMSFNNVYEGTPTDFARAVLAGAECPVLMAPPDFNAINEIIFTYDGSRSAVFAIKQFTYLFPQLADKKVILLEVNETEADQVLEKEKIGSLLKMHYSGIGFQVLQGRAGEELFKYLLNKKDSFVVMGAFGRGIFSELFKPSTAHLMLGTICCPFFIAHH